MLAVIMALRTSRTFDVIFVFTLVLLLGWAAIYRVAVGDWVYFLQYTPSPKVVTVANEAGMNEVGKRLFYRTNPQFAQKQAVAEQCDIERLGCITGKGEVFILDEPGQPDQTLVTAAHEMLHLAYRRLTDGERERLAPLLDEMMTKYAVGLEDDLRS